MPLSLSDLKILIRGAGEMATGTACRLHRAGFRKLVMTEIGNPLAVRRLVSFCEAVYQGRWSVEDFRAARIETPEEAETLWQQGLIPVLVDPENRFRPAIDPDVVVDGILAKKNLGTTIEDADLVIALGPGFYAGRDAHFVVETNRGHDLGRLIERGEAAPDTGIPGDIGGQTSRRVIRAPASGIFESQLEIGALVAENQTVGHVNGSPVNCSIAGVLRGLIRPGTLVTPELKIGDVDPRGTQSYCRTISEKARAIAGSVLEAILIKYNTPN